VAVIGASGIGKNHARWFHQHSCEVGAFMGSSPASIERTQELLRADNIRLILLHYSRRTRRFNWMKKTDGAKSSLKALNNNNSAIPISHYLFIRTYARIGAKLEL
jgi:hypothetical protein